MQFRPGFPEVLSPAQQQATTPEIAKADIAAGFSGPRQDQGAVS